MNANAFDPVAYKVEQVDHWNAVAHGWARWWPTFENGGGTLSDRLVAWADIEPGDNVLDVATGIGEPAMTAARAASPHGRVVGIDQAPRMLQIARERAERHGVTNVSFNVEDAEALGFEAEFDAALSRWGLMLVPHPDAVLDGLQRALKPGARFAASVWSSAERVPFIYLVQSAIQDVLQPPAPPDEAPDPFHLADVEMLQRMATDAGFSEVTTERLTIDLEWASVDDFIAFHEDVSPPMIALSDESSERQEAVRRRLKALAETYADPDGRLRMPNETICVTGRAQPVPQSRHLPRKG